MRCFTPQEFDCPCCGYVMGVAELLHSDGLITHRLRWGGDRDRDMEVKDNDFDDLMHFEFVT